MAKTREEEREYQRAWYKNNRDKIREYQRRYNAKRRFQLQAKKSRAEFKREAYRSAFTALDIMNLPVGARSEQVLNDILSGKRVFVG